MGPLSTLVLKFQGRSVSGLPPPTFAPVKPLLPLVPNFKGHRKPAGYRRPPSPSKLATDPLESLQNPPQKPSTPLESPPNHHHRPQTPSESHPSRHQPTPDHQKTKQFRRNAQLVPAKPRTHPSQMPKGSAATEPQGNEVTEPKASQAKRRRREPKGQPSEARQPNSDQAQRGSRAKSPRDFAPRPP